MMIISVFGGGASYLTALCSPADRHLVTYLTIIKVGKPTNWTRWAEFGHYPEGKEQRVCKGNRFPVCQRKAAPGDA